MIKKIVFLVALMLQPLLANSQKAIQMEKDGGVYKIACKVNGARMKMIFDTGASSVSLSMSIANYLYDNDYITKDDIIGKGKSQTADGSIVDHVVINLKDIEIDGLHLKNVKATVIDGQDAPLLLGQSAIQKLGPVTINGNTLIINNASSRSLSDEEVEQLREKAYSLCKEGSYYGAIEVYSTLRKNLQLNTWDYNCYAHSCNYVGQHKTAVELVLEWESGTEYQSAEEWEKAGLYSEATYAYSNLEDNYSAIKYLEKEITSKQLADEEFSALNYRVYAGIYADAMRYDIAMKYYKKALNKLLSDNDYSVADIYNGTITDDAVKKELGSYLRSYSYIYDKSNNYKVKESTCWQVQQNVVKRLQ